MAGQSNTAICASCTQEKPISEYYKRKSGYIFSYCKPCARQIASKRARERRQTDGNTVRHMDNMRRKNNPERYKKKDRLTSKKRSVDEVYKEKSRQYNKSKGMEAVRIEGKVYVCAVCKSTYCRMYGVKAVGKTCSEECSRILFLRGKVRKEKVRKHRKRGVHCESVDPFKVFERDGYMCQACGTNTPIGKRGSIDADAPELDHIVPLAKGGQHTYSNTQCLCRKCNRRKSDYLPQELLE